MTTNIRYLISFVVLLCAAWASPSHAAVAVGLPSAATPTIAAAASCRPGVEGFDLASPRVRWRISPCLGGVQSVRLKDAQFAVPARTPPAGIAKWAEPKFAAGALELVDTWDAKWDPFRDTFDEIDLAAAQLSVRKGGAVETLNVSNLAAYQKQDTLWGVVAHSASEVVLVWPDPNRVKSPIYLHKRYTPGTAEAPYTLRLEVSVLNLGATAVHYRLAHEVTTFQDPGHSGGGFLAVFAGPPDTKGAGFAVTGEATHLDAKALIDADLDKRSRAALPEWMGIDSRYFLMAAAPVSGLPPQSEVRLTALANGVVMGRLRSASLTIDGAGATCVPAWYAQTWGGSPCRSDKDLRQQTIRYDLYTGPKEIDQLKPAGHGLSTAIDFGWFGVIAMPMLAVLKFAHSVTSSWPVAILLLTLMVKALLWPITGKSMKSMRNMQKIKPELDKLRVELEAKAKKQGKDKADPQELNQATFALYKKHNVNPLGGCLPLMLQMPIYIALYRTINASVDLYNQPLFGWVTDLTQKDPYYVLPLVLGAVMFAQQKLTPQAGGDPMQQKMMLYFMPALFTMMMLQLPSGLTLYILTNTVLGIVQTMVYNRADTGAQKA